MSPSIEQKTSFFWKNVSELPYHLATASIASSCVRAAASTTMIIGLD